MESKDILGNLLKNFDIDKFRNLFSGVLGRDNNKNSSSSGVIKDRILGYLNNLRDTREEEVGKKTTILNLLDDIDLNGIKRLLPLDKIRSADPLKIRNDNFKIGILDRIISYLEGLK